MLLTCKSCSEGWLRRVISCLSRNFGWPGPLCASGRKDFPKSPAILFLVSAVLCLLASGAVAQDAQRSSDRVAPVVFDGYRLFPVRGISGLPAKVRAQNISNRMLDVAQSSTSDEVVVTTEQHRFGHQILANGKPLLVVVQSDADEEGVSDTEAIASVYATRIREAILTYRADRTFDARKRGLVNTVLWTIAFLVFCFSLRIVNRIVSKRVDRYFERVLAGLEEVTQQIVKTRAIASVLRMASRGAIVAVFLIGTYYYVSIILFNFAESRAIARVLLDYFTDPIFSAGDAIINFLPDLVVLVLIFLVVRYLIHLCRVAFENIEAGTIKIEGFQPHWIWPSFNIIRLLLIISGFVLAYPYIPGSDSAAFQGISILVGVMVSIGSNSVVSNVLAGLFVIYRQSTNLGDVIQVGGHVGRISAIKLTETHLRSYKNELISIPNAQLLNSEIVNYSQVAGVRGVLVSTKIGIGYDEDHTKIEMLLKKAAGRVPELLRSPPPLIFCNELGDFAVTYEVIGFADVRSSRARAKSGLHTAILDAFHEAGVQIMSPHYEGDPDSPKIPEKVFPD